MADSTAPKIFVGDRSELIASIPALLGFHPSNSLIVLLGNLVDGQIHVDGTWRVDLPDRREYDSLATQLLEAVGNVEVNAVILAVIHDAADEVGHVHRGLIDVVATSLKSRDIAVCDALWAQAIRPGARWHSYTTGQTGQVTDPAATVAAATRVVEGQAIADSRADFAAVVTPNPDESVMRRRRSLLGEVVTAVEAEQTANRRRFVANAVQTLRRALADAADGRLSTEDVHIVRMAVLLTDLEVRDTLIAGELNVERPVAESVWATIAREAPPDLRADPACLLAISACIRGDGPLAMVAVHAAVTDNPKHSLSSMLAHAMDLGIPPQAIADALSNL